VQVQKEEFKDEEEEEEESAEVRPLVAVLSAGKMPSINPE
jgi:hypothetical protein